MDIDSTKSPIKGVKYDSVKNIWEVDNIKKVDNTILLKIKNKQFSAKNIGFRLAKLMACQYLSLKLLNANLVTIHMDQVKDMFYSLNEKYLKTNPLPWMDEDKEYDK